MLLALNIIFSTDRRQYHHSCSLQLINHLNMSTNITFKRVFFLYFVRRDSVTDICPQLATMFQEKNRNGHLSTETVIREQRIIAVNEWTNG